MAVIFVGATTPDARWPDAAVVALGTVTGVVAGSILALVSWPLLPLLDGSTATNEVVKSILRSPVHTLLDGSVFIVRVRGTVSGRLLDIPAQFAGTGTDLVIVARRPDSKRWWRNLVPHAPVRVLLRGRWRAAVASVPYQGDEEFERAAGVYRARWPRVRLDPDSVIVTVRLD